MEYIMKTLKCEKFIYLTLDEWGPEFSDEDKVEIMKNRMKQEFINMIEPEMVVERDPDNFRTKVTCTIMLPVKYVKEECNGDENL